MSDLFYDNDTDWQLPTGGDGKIQGSDPYAVQVNQTYSSNVQAYDPPRDALVDRFVDNAVRDFRATGARNLSVIRANGQDEFVHVCDGRAGCSYCYTAMRNRTYW
ncbi:hypothetical protein Dda_6116 [Drechslerella dactyloides]|uniref:Uncharacterized protein n=1 Tax=Drechslerella dactyloides TaxID=74499 RepID=A0AAD6IUY4_DREDA|nr:hypothetical protein Dda_6116 [Drechslerella dactyloides]